MTLTRTAIELDRDGKPARKFHRRANVAWTHSTDAPFLETTTRGGAIVRLPCPLCEPRDGEAIGRASRRSARTGTASGVAP